MFCEPTSHRHAWTLRLQARHLRCMFGTAMLLLGIMPMMASCNQGQDLRLNVMSKNGEIIAVLANVSSHPVKTVGNHLTAVPGSGGFYIKLRDHRGVYFKYCGMIDGAIPAEQLLKSGGSIVYRDTVKSITGQYCLKKGKYIGRVMYYNSIDFGVTSYSQPIASKEFEIDIQE